MDIKQVIKLTEANYMNTYGERQQVLITGGKGCELYDENGKTYLDLLAGIAVNSLGYGHPAITQAIKNQADKIIHCSNLFYTEEQAQLATMLVKSTCADKVFFCNSGGEANEGAIKLARKHFFKLGVDRYEVISMINSFHGRTLATLAATGQEKYRKPYGPMPQGFINVPFKDIEAVKAAMTEHTAAILVEPIQGEGGVIEAGVDYLYELRKLCDSEGILLIFDEVQCGMGRTGRLFAHQLYGVEPDIFTSAKALAGGVPLGAVLCKNSCNAFEPGDHGTTFGGNPLACAVGIAVLTELQKPNFLYNVEVKGDYFKNRLNSLKDKLPDAVVDVRGRGLMLGVQLGVPVKQVQAELLEAGFITATAGGNTLRIVPPLVITTEQIDTFIDALGEILSK